MRVLPLFLGLFALLLIILTSCSSEQPEVSSVDADVNKTPVSSVKITETNVPDLCKTVTCSPGESCSEGKCVCATNFKQCENTCISSNKCCITKDCSSDQKCENNVCVDANTCNYLEKWDSAKNKCICSDKTLWCAEQEKCIAYDKCCDANDCNAEGLITRVCKKTEFLPYVCLGDDAGVHCTNVRLGATTQFEFSNLKKNAVVEQVFAKGTVNLKVEGLEPRKVPLKLKFDLPNNLWARVDEISIRGGNCKED